MKTLRERVEGVRKAAQYCVDDQEYIGEVRLETVKGLKEVLQSLPGAEMTEDDLVAIVMKARMQSKVDLPVSIRETIRVLKDAGVVLVKS